jgi:hypothetical protein
MRSPAESSAEPINERYARTLIAAAQSPSSLLLFIAEFPHELDSTEQAVYPSAIAPAHLLAKLPLVHYADIRSEKKNSSSLSLQAAVWLQPMQAGIGSSIVRSRYLSKKFHCPPEEVSLGAKGSDLAIELAFNAVRCQVSLAEVQMLRAVQIAAAGEFAEVFYSDLVSEKTADAIANLWRQPLRSFRKSESPPTYGDYFRTHAKLHFFSQAPQTAIPALNSEGLLLNEIAFPAGHGFFGFRALLAAVHTELRPRSDLPLLGVISNGEDLSPKPFAALGEWMLRRECPIAMITTTKTAVDCKGGQIAVISQGNKEEAVFPTIIEIAQAEEAGQRDLFVQLGLRAGDQAAYFNTNTVILNYAVLAPLLTELYREVGEEEFCRIIAPTVIKNTKKIVDKSGKAQSITHLEGAMGSVMLNLDRYWRTRFGQGLVSFVNISREERFEFFAPVKSAFDFYHLFYSGGFHFTSETLSFKVLASSPLPLCVFADPAYGDVDFVLEAFAGCQLDGLKKLQVEGKVCFADVVLQGTVHVSNQRAECIDLQMVPELKEFRQGGRLVLRDMGIIFSVHQEAPLIISSRRALAVGRQAEA